MNVSNFLDSRKFSKSKKSIKDNFSSKLNDSLNSQIKRTGSQMNSFQTPTNYGFGNGHKKHHNDQQQQDSYVHKSFNNKPLSKNHFNTMQQDFDADISDIVKKDNISPNKVLKSSKNLSDKKQQFKGKEKVQSLIQQLSEDSFVQLQNVNKIIDTFNKKITLLIDSQFKKFKSAIIQTVEMIFDSSSNNFKKAFETQKQLCYNKILKTKEQLQTICYNLQSMKKDIKSSNWRKAQEDLKHMNIQKQLYELTSEIQEFKKAPPLSARLSKKKMYDYESALVALLDISNEEDQTGKVKKK